MLCNIAKSFFGRHSIKTIRAAIKISMPFESCKQDLSFGGCYFSVSFLVLEIVTKTCPQCHSLFGTKNTSVQGFSSKLGSFFGHVLAYISRTRKDTEKLHPPNERSCLQLSNGVLNIFLALKVLKIYPPKKMSRF